MENTFDLPMNGKDLITHEKWDEKEHDALDKRLSRIEYLIDDDPRTGRKGMASKVDEIHKRFVQSNGIFQFLVKMVAIIGAGYGFISQLMSHIKWK